MTLEDEVLFQRYHIIGYAPDSDWVRNGATPTSDHDPGRHVGEGFIDSTDGHVGDSSSS